MKPIFRLFVLAALVSTTAAYGDPTQTLAEPIPWDSEYTSTWGPSTGESLPELTVRNPAGDLKQFADLTGEEGLLIFFVRSTNW